jgi:hypothetical protein
MQDTAGSDWGTESHFQRFATLLKKRMIRNGWRHCAVGQRTTQFCGGLEAAVAAQREKDAQVCEAIEWSDEAKFFAKAIRERND